MRAWLDAWRGCGRSSASKVDHRWEATMLIGVPREIKADEYRVGLIPSTAKELVARGHAVMVETLAGDGAGISDQEYAAAGAQIVASADQIFLRAALIVKVKEPLAAERSKLRRGQIIFTSCGQKIKTAGKSSSYLIRAWSRRGSSATFF